MRVVPPITALLGLAACSGVIGGADDADDGRSALRTVGTALIGAVASPPRPAPPDPDVVRAQLTPEVVAALPGPTLLVVLERVGAISLPGQVARNGDVATFETEDAITLSLRQGLLVATRGLGFDLMSADVDEPLAAILSRADGATATRSQTYLDAENRAVRRSFACGYRTARSGAAGPGIVRVHETCRGRGLAFENRYDLRGTRIVASRQWIGPFHGHLEIEQVRF